MIKWETSVIVARFKPETFHMRGMHSNHYAFVIVLLQVYLFYFLEKPVPQKPAKPAVSDNSAVTYQTKEDGDSYFFSYFMMMCIVVVLVYIGYHNKQKVCNVILSKVPALIRALVIKVKF